MVCYKDYDARGHAGRKVDPASAACGSIGANGQRDLRFTYDRAERLEEIREGGNGGRPLKELEYETAGIARLRRLSTHGPLRGSTHGAKNRMPLLAGDLRQLLFNEPEPIRKPSASPRGGRRWRHGTGRSSRLVPRQLRVLRVH